MQPNTVSTRLRLVYPSLFTKEMSRPFSRGFIEV
jgi:hypothetical protein